LVISVLARKIALTPQNCHHEEGFGPTRDLLFLPASSVRHAKQIPGSARDDNFMRAVCIRVRASSALMGSCNVGVEGAPHAPHRVK
jgi:hypothetical protein